MSKTQSVERPFDVSKVLVGKYCFNKQYQGWVMAHVQGGSYLVQCFFSWVDGSPGSQRVFDLTDGRWEFFDDEEQWNDVTRRHIEKEVNENL